MNRFPHSAFPTRTQPLVCVFASIAVAILILAASPTTRAEEPDRRPFLEGVLGAAELVADVADHSARPLIRDYLLDETDADRYGLELDQGWEQTVAKMPNAPVVILIHGFNSTPLRNIAVMAPIREAGFATGAFAYPNDWSISESAALLSAELKEFAAAYPDRQIALVTHSMGGLVARACVEDPTLDSGNVTRLVMIAPPTHGSLVARFSIGADLWEHGIGRADGDFKTRFREAVADGLNEAADDLAPGSRFLTTLNARQRNPRIRYAIFLGTHAAVTDRESRVLRGLLRKSLVRVEWLGGHADDIDATLAEMDELIEGKGDGVVSLASGRLEGVDDVVILPFDHVNCTGEPRDANDPAHQVRAELLARLR
jgi:pimeloyl-ACP methyl ester carboxylesterase